MYWSFQAALPSPLANSARLGVWYSREPGSQTLSTPSIAGSGPCSRSTGLRRSKMRRTLALIQPTVAGSWPAYSSVPQRKMRPAGMLLPGTAPMSRALMSVLEGMKGADERRGTSVSGAMGSLTGVLRRASSSAVEVAIL